MGAVVLLARRQLRAHGARGALTAAGVGLGDRVCVSATWADYDNDGRPDLFVTNGHVQDDIQLFQNNLRYAERCQLFRGDGGLRFTEISDSAGEPFRRELADWAKRHDGAALAADVLEGFVAR